jgi:hypothetical protein
MTARIRIEGLFRWQSMIEKKGIRLCKDFVCAAVTVRLA